MFKKTLKFVVYSTAIFIAIQIVAVFFFGFNFFWSNRISVKKENSENEYTMQYNLDSVQLKRFKSTKGYYHFNQTDNADSLRNYLDQAIKEMNEPNSSSNIGVPVQKNQ